MKKLILSLSLLVGTALASSGQVAILLMIFGDELSTEELHLSIDGAFNLSSASNLDSGKLFLGANFGLGLHIMLNEQWELNPQFRPLSQKGVRKAASIIDVPSEIVDPVNHWRLNYIEIPLMIRYWISPEASLAVGPQVSFLTGANQISSGTYTNELEAEIKMDTKAMFRKLNYSIPFEVAYRMELSNKKTTSKLKVDFFGRYCPDIRSLFKKGYGFDDAKNTTFQLGVSFPFIKS